MDIKAPPATIPPAISADGEVIPPGTLSLSELADRSAGGAGVGRDDEAAV